MMDKVFNIIKYNSENALLDFKRNEYPLGKHAKRNEFLKDISAMVNHPSNETKYIIIGIQEKNGLASGFFDLKTTTDQAKYQQFVEENIEPKINFEYKSFNYSGHNLAVFIISENDSRPYLFRKNVYRATDNYLEHKIGDGYIRTGTSTRKLNREDFELIYLNRLENKDRITDVKVIPIFSESIDWLDVYDLDFSIENLSNKSIEFDIEFRVIRKDGVGVLKTCDLEKESAVNELAQTYPQYFTPTIDPTLQLIEIAYRKSYYKVWRLQRLRLSQYDTLERVFLNDIFVSYIGHLQEVPIMVELIVRSDEFKNGPFIQKYEFTLQK